MAAEQSNEGATALGWSHWNFQVYSDLPPAVQSFLKTAAVAAPMVLVLAWIGGRSYRAYRNKVDRAAADRTSDREEIAVEFGLPQRPNPKQFETAGSKARAADWREKLHEPAIAFKNGYYEYIGRCGVLLASVFVLMALNLTVFRSDGDLNKYSATIDLFAILYVLVHWWRSRLANQDWVLKRIHAELMRQWRHLVFAFSCTEDEIEAAYAKASHRIETGILRPKSRFLQLLGFGLTSEELETRIEDYWKELSQKLRAKASIEKPSNWNVTLIAYVYDRPINQLQWYRMRHRQFSRAGVLRGGIMTTLFLFTSALAIGNAFLCHTSTMSDSNLGDWLNLGVLIATAISAALTYWYLSRNERSISHRYVTQRREIESWLMKTTELVKQDRAALTYDQVLEFEALMVSELIDWVHVTSHDVVELGA